LRPATNDESLGAELINRYLGDLRWDIQRNKGPKKYVDVRAEGIPDIPGENENASNAHSEEEPMGEEAVPAAPLSGDVSPQPMSEPALSREPTNAAPPPPPARDRSRSPSASSSQREGRSTAQPGTPVGGERPPFPYPFDRRPTSTNSLISSNLYVDMQAESIKGGDAKISNEFYVSEGAAEFEPSENFFALKKIPVDAEINIASLSENARKLFTGPKGSREKEWANMISQVKESGGPAVRIHRGARAREIKQNYPQRLIPSRWLDKWKDMGDEYETPLSAPEVLEANVPEHHGSKSRWILQGFHDPDITILRRSVPTPETSDVPLCLQMLASLRARGWVADVRGAFSQGMRNQRTEPLFALPPPGGIPGEQEDIVIEILAEIYGLISGPPGWRRSLFTTLKQVEFKAHPLAPCVVLMYEEIDSKPNQFSGLVCVETDDLLGGGIGPKY